jgi:indole-3-glycerol phosphate synthase
MPSILDKIVSYKLNEIEKAKAARPLQELESRARSSDVRDFLNALTGRGISLIAEIKKASPSKGLIRADFQPALIAQAYQQGGANCLSVLTDEHFFQGHLDFLSQVRDAVDLPVLRKDFILDRYQVYEARVAGADAVLLIAECLDESKLKDLHDEIVGLGMTPLVELYEIQNVDKVLRCEPKLVGINNRDLNTFEVDLQHTVRLRREIPENILLVGESGIFSRADALTLESAGVDAMLVGESLMRAHDIAQATASLLGR